jgi:C-terminal processing protease CtpA/Prc
MRRSFIFFLLLAVFFIFTITANAQMDRIDRERMHYMLRTTSSEVAKNFYDPTMKGLDWKALTAEAEQKIEAAKSMSEAITIISMLVDKLQDSHTVFIPPSRVNRPLFGFEAKMFGNEARIYSIKPGGSADKAGLQRGDRILQIFNYHPDRKNFDQAMVYYRFLHPMPELKITYQRGSEAPQTVVVPAKVKKGTMKEDISTDESYERYLVENFSESEKYFYGAFDSDIGFLQLPSFGAETLPSPDITKPKAFILDLRGNPGGRVDSLGEFAGRFESKPGVLANMVGRKKTEPVKIKPHGDRFNVPLFILVDSRSASAAEMFARYFQKTGQAKIVGDTTSGRVNASLEFNESVGTDQSQIQFWLQVSVSRVAFEDGEELEHHPIVPDYACLPSEADLRAQADPCLKKAVALARKAAGRTEDLPDSVASQVEGLIAQRNEYIAQELKRPD